MSDAALCESKTASSPIRVGDLRPGMIVRHNDRIFRVLLADVAPGPAGGQGVFVRLRALTADSVSEDTLSPDITVELLSVQRHRALFEHPGPGGFVFSDAATGAGMRVAADEIGPKAEFLVPGMTVFIDIVDGQFSSLDFPEFVEVEVADTQTIHNPDDEDLDKPATLANGFRVMVPLHVRKGDKIVLHFPTLRYADPSAAARKEHAIRATVGQE